MRVIARHQLYLDYGLPRTVDWPDKPIKFTYLDEGIETFVLPRMHDDPLFPGEIDRELFDMRVHFSNASPYVSGEGYFTVREKCLDRIRVDVYLNIEDESESISEDDEDLALLAATDSANVFLAHCRVLSRDSFIRGIDKRYSLQDDSYFTLNPRTVCWYEASRGEPLPLRSEGKSCTAHSGSRELAVTKPVYFERVAKSIKTSEYPPLYLALMTDAASLLRTVRLRESLMMMGTACEVAGKTYLEEQSKGAIRDPEEIVPKHTTFARRWFHYIPIHFERRSFADSHPEKFSDLEKMYWTRNNVAHNGKPYYEDPHEGSQVDVSMKIATAFLSASEWAVDWLMGINRFANDNDA